MTIEKEDIGRILQDPGGRIFLIKRRSDDDSLPGFWELPSGGVGEGESRTKTVIRETKEESGVGVPKVVLSNEHENG